MGSLVLILLSVLKLDTANQVFSVIFYITKVKSFTLLKIKLVIWDDVLIFSIVLYKFNEQDKPRGL